MRGWLPSIVLCANISDRPISLRIPQTNPRLGLLCYRTCSLRVGKRYDDKSFTNSKPNLKDEQKISSVRPPLQQES